MRRNVLLVPALWLISVGATVVAATVIEVEGSCTLVDAIHAANGDVSVGGCSPGFGADTIRLTGDVVLTEVDNVSNGANGLPVLDSEIAIDGRGFLVSRSLEPGTPGFRIFDVRSGPVIVRRVAVSNGSAPGGAGIRAQSSNEFEFFLVDSSIDVSDSIGLRAGGIDAVTLVNVSISGSDGPATLVDSLRRFALVNSTVTGNTGPNSTGAYISYLESGVLLNSTVSNNTTNIHGGGVVLRHAGKRDSPEWERGTAPNRTKPRSVSGRRGLNGRLRGAFAAIDCSVWGCPSFPR